MLAIVIPYYKKTYFEQTLQSLANQTDKRFKVYIGDDNSHENCSDLITTFKEKLNLFYHRFENNLGNISLTKQWERCVDLSKNEEWLMILGDDDWLGENVVEEFYLTKNTNVEVIRFATKVYYQNKNQESIVWTNPKLESGISYITRKINGETRGSLSEFIFNKEVYFKKKLTHYPSAFYSDDKLMLDMAENNILSNNNAIVFVRISNESLSGRAEVKNDRLIAAKHQFYKYLFQNKLAQFDKKTQKNIIEFLLNHTIKHSKNKKLLFSIYFKTFMLFEPQYFWKINKKIIKLNLNFE